MANLHLIEMKTYWEIPGPSRGPQTPCIAFYKFDGLNFRAEWSRKRGWYKFGTRRVLIDETAEQFGGCVPLFLAKLAEPLERIFTDNKHFRGVESVVVFSEVYSDNSFAGWFPQEDGVLRPQFPTGEEAKIAMIDVNIHKKGTVLPRDFVKLFDKLDHVAHVVYEGNFSKDLVRQVRDGQIVEDAEGIVAKGVNLGKKKNPQHGLWMRKAKTKWWMDKLKGLAADNEEFRKVLADNEKEQS